MNKKDASFIEHIIDYCQKLSGLRERFGDDKTSFLNDGAYQLSASMCIIQIGEFIGRLSEETKQSMDGVNWTGLKAMRNIFAHDYGRTDFDILWETIKNEIPDLKNKCETAVKKEYMYKLVSKAEYEELADKGVVKAKRQKDDSIVIKYHKDDEPTISSVAAAFQKNHCNQGDQPMKR